VQNRDKGTGLITIKNENGGQSFILYMQSPHKKLIEEAVIKNKRKKMKRVNLKQQLMKLLFIVFTVLTVISCSENKTGWSREYKDKLINSCISEAKRGNNTIDDKKVNDYCNCYQQNLEKRYPAIKQIEAADKQEIIKAAEECMSVLLK
jgi:hypothetical protein